MHCKSYSHFFSKKYQNICVSLDVNFNESLTNDIVSFEQLGPNQDHKHDFLCFSGVFALLNAYAFLKYIQSFLTKSEFKAFFVLAAAGAAGVIFLTVVGLTWAGRDCFLLACMK